MAHARLAVKWVREPCASQMSLCASAACELKCSAHYGTATHLECAELICRTAQYNPYYTGLVS